MGWLYIVGGYFSLTLVGVLVGFLHPIFHQFWLVKSQNTADRVAFVKLLYDSMLNSFRIGILTFLLLVIFAFVGCILFSVWAVLTRYGT